MNDNKSKNNKSTQTKLNPILKFILICFFALILITVSVLAYTYASLPDVSKMVEGYTQIEPTVLYDINGEVIDKVIRENREIVKIDKIPKSLQMAFVTIEDRKFYSHHGFDVKRTGKAILINVVKMKKAQGGSTITQQLARNAFLTLEKTMTRKVKEAIITLEIERKYTKDEILEKYLNEIYFGEGAYGVQTASKIFFNKDVSKLNLAESAMLAGIPNRPEKYSPFKHLENAEKRQKLILSQMLKYGAITQEEYDEALEYKIKLADVKKLKKRDTKAPEFTDMVIKQLFEKFGEQAVYETGLKIHTTLDLRMQRAALDSFKSSAYIKKYAELQGALVTMESDTGYVKAMVGGRDFKAGNFNRAVYAKRQPGSSFKPFVYFTALKKGIPMNKMFEDSPLTIGSWTPKNYDGGFRGSMTMAEALEKSKNIPTIRVLQKVTIDSVIEVCRDAGFTSPIPKNYTMGLGSMSVTPIEITTAYCSFANGGYKVKPVYIVKVEDKSGKVLYEDKSEKEKVFEPTDVSLIVRMMENVVIYGSGSSANIGINQAGKTGTTSDYTDAWFTGFTPELVTSIYYGYDNNKHMKSGMTGGEVAAPIWGKYYGKLVNRKIYKPKRFKFMDKAISSGKIFSSVIDISTGQGANETSTRIRTLLFKHGKSAPAVVKEADIKEVIEGATANNSAEEITGDPESDVNSILEDIPETSPSESIGDSILD